MRDVMIDLETRGTGPGCAIVSIGAVAFDPAGGSLGAEFYTVVSAASCRDHALREEAGTMKWWGEQSPEARAVLAQSEAADAPHLEVALARLADFMIDQAPASKLRPWGNGSDFDNAILAYLYRVAGAPLPWFFWNSRCFRTLKSLGTVPEPPREGTHHNALDDARHQARWACALYAATRAVDAVG